MNELRSAACNSICSCILLLLLAVCTGTWSRHATYMERLHKLPAKPKHGVLFQLGKAMQGLLSRMWKANRRQLHSIPPEQVGGNFHSSSRFVDHWPMDQHMTTCPRQTTSLGLVAFSWPANGSIWKFWIQHDPTYKN